MRRILAIPFCMLALITSALAENIDAFRTWTSADGRSIVAKAIEIDHSEQTVRLERDDGLRFTISFDQLAASDAHLIRTLSGAAADDNDSQSVNGADESPPLPKRHLIDDVPMVRQKENYCVPASAAMIANFHNIDTHQDQIAQLSSEASENNFGTYPRDMLRAMEKLGFVGEQLIWQSASEFHDRVLDRIKQNLFSNGPIYVSYRPGIFGSSGHGCVIIGYDDRKSEFTIHNPWGNVFKDSYSSLANSGRGVVFIEPPIGAPVASSDFINGIKKVIPRFLGQLFSVPHRLEQSNVPFELIWCSRADSRSDRRFAKDTARKNGRKILELAFERNPAVLITENNGAKTEAYLFVTRPKEGARFIVCRIDSNGWSEPSPWTLGQLTRSWPTQIQDSQGNQIWELPMIELHPQR